MRKYRIVEIQGGFVSQVKKNLFSEWKGLDRGDFYLWGLPEYQVKYCKHATKADAQHTINRYKDLDKLK